MTHALGIDVSKHNGNAIDWQRIADGGFSFAFLRYGVGDGSDNTGKDPTFDRNLTEIRKTNMLVGAYWYMWSVNISTQINLFTQLDPTLLDLPMVIDAEQTNIAESDLRFFLREVERITGRVPMLYTRRDILHSIIGTGQVEWIKHYPLWVAQYPFDVVGDYPTIIPNQYSNWRFWQWTAEGQAPGHIGPVDLNYYNGTVDDLCCRYRYPDADFAWPVDSPVVTQVFGNNPAFYGPLIGAAGLGHEGIDFRAPHGSNIYAIDGGIVYSVFEGGAYGRQVRIDHQNGYKSTYAHLDKWVVSVGQRVNKGQKIGEADNTGNSSGSHLHLTVYLENATANGLTAYPNDIINPTSFLHAPDFQDLVYVPVRSIATTILNIRTGPGTNYSDIGDIPAGAELLGVPEGLWWRIKYAGIEGYALSTWMEVITTDQPVLLRTKSSVTLNLNIRETPNGTILGKLAPGGTIMGFPVSSEAWWKVVFNNADAWMASEWLEVVP